MTENLTEQKSELADANRILFDQGVLDAFGHVSVRSATDSDTFLLSRNRAPALVSAGDIQQFDLFGSTEDERRPYLERFIHAGIYRARPDVVAIVHSHSSSVLPFGISTVPLRPVMHMAGFLPQETPVFEIRNVAGPTSDLLVRDHATSDALADALGVGSVVLMRGHGSVAVADSLRSAVYRAVYTEVNAKIQAEAAKLGPYTALTAEEAAAASATNAAQIDRAWALWRANATTD